MMCSPSVTKCARILAEKSCDIAFIESATSGRMCAEFALTENSGDIIRGGLVCYSVFVKEQFLKVPHKTIQTYTPESEEVTEALAKGGSKLFNADITVAVTGLIREGGSETPEKPVGTMFLYILMGETHLKHREVFKGSPTEIMMQTIDRAAELITSHLTST